MSADMMIICQEDNSNHKGNTDACFFVDETSAGNPWHEFGKWFQSHYCGAPGMFEQLAGVKEHDHTKVTESDVVAVEHALADMECHENLDKPALIEFMKSHVGKHISTENW